MQSPRGVSPPLPLTTVLGSIICSTALCFAQSQHAEEEPNDSHAAANVFTGIIGGDTFTGLSTGTAGVGPTSVDCFRIRTALAPRNIYRHRLSRMTRGDHRLELPRLANCVPGTSIDTAQTSRTADLPLQWYGFGMGEEVRWIISGDTQAPNYTVTMDTQLVQVRDDIPPIAPGAIRFESLPIAGVGVALYDPALNLVAGAQSGVLVSRTIPEGSYVLAVTYAMLNEGSCPFVPQNQMFMDSGIVSGDVSGRVFQFRISHPAGTLSQIFDIDAREVLWFALRVYAPFTCGSADFDQNGDSGTDDDISAFFRCLSGQCCPTCDPRRSDFNADGDYGTDQDIEAFFRVLAGGAC
jgi:hypothetical protein